MSRILVLGAGGMLGHKVCQLLSSDHEVVAAFRKDAAPYRRLDSVYAKSRLLGGVDVLDEAALASTMDQVRPDAVVNCVGVVKQLKEAENRMLSVAINAYLPHRLAQLCGQCGIRLVHVSTDCVFAGKRGNYTESDPSDAQDLYGKSKYLGETDASETAAITLRTSIIGRELKRPTHGLVEWFLTQRGKACRGFARAIYSGLTTLELARVIGLVLGCHRQLSGTYHVAGPVINKYDLLLLVSRVFGLEVAIERDDSFRCDRSLVMGPFDQATGYTSPTWEEMIVQMHQDPTPYDSWLSGIRA